MRRWAIVTALGLAVLHSAAWAAEDRQSRYGLCGERVEQVKVSEHAGSDGRISITVWLGDEARAEFKALSERSMGEVVEIVFDGATLERATIRASVDSGILVLGSWRSREAANRVAHLIAEDNLGVPCGTLD